MEKGGIGSGELCYNDCFGSFGWQEQIFLENMRVDEFSSSRIGLVFGHLYGQHFFDLLGIATFLL